MGKVIIFSAPSGSGKTTIVRHLLERYPQFEFSISATSRAPRGQERDGVDYYFLSHGEFMQAVAENRFVEELRRRLEGRGTDAPEVIDRRVAKAEFELTKAPEFDHVVVNDCLDEAVCGTCSILDQFIAR